MDRQPDWLPDIVRLEDYGGQWRKYEEAVYARFYSDFIASRPTLQDMPVYVTINLVRGKERTFWHCIQEGPVEEERIPDLRRCERISWIRPVIEHVDSPEVRQWVNERRGKNRSILWVDSAEFLVVLEPRGSAWYLWTAYPVTSEWKKVRLFKECEAFYKSQRRP
jgi:hypothetical protein